MNESSNDRALADLLDAYVAATAAQPSYGALAEWVRRYPRYAAELTEFTAHWSLAAHLSSPPDAATDEAALVRRGMDLLQPLLQRGNAQRPADDPITTLLAAAKAEGLSVQDLAERSGLTVPLVMKLDRRLIRAATIPAAVVSGVAQALRRDATAVSAYLLQAGPRFAAGASYLAREAPALAGQEDFLDAVRADRTLPEARRAALLAMADPSTTGDTP
jgi:hypothetical protein